MTFPVLLLNVVRWVAWAAKPHPATVDLSAAEEAAGLLLRLTTTTAVNLARLITADHQGSLALTAQPGGGTELTIRLPQPPGRLTA